jgi:2-polyprenyl-6-methoxyphenol hydroxylase-like FAD-dependent oxidoreductase
LGLGIEGKIEWGKEIVSYNLPVKSEGGEESAEVRFRDRTTADGRFIVGADGIKSRVRRQLQPERRVLDLQRWVLWGRVSLTTALRDELGNDVQGEDVMSWFMGIDEDKNVQCVQEPMVWSTVSTSVKDEIGGKFTGIRRLSVFRSIYTSAWGDDAQIDR